MTDMAATKTSSHSHLPTKSTSALTTTTTALAAGIEPKSSAGGKNYTNGIYYPDWACNISPPAELPIGNVTHIYYTFVGLNSDGSIFLTEPEPAGKVGSERLTSATCLKSLRHLRDSQKPGLRLLLSVGGGVGSANFSNVATWTDKRRNFATKLKELVDLYGFDGIDIDWETPASTVEGDNYLRLLKTLREYFTPGEYLLTSAFAATQWALQQIDVAEFVSQLDEFHLMAYDYYGPWNKTSGYHAQLYSLAETGDSGSSAVSYCLRNNTDLAEKLILGVPLYAQGFPGINGTDQEWNNRIMPEDGIQLQYNELGLGSSDSSFYNQSVVGASMYNDTEQIWYSFDSPQSVAAKVAFVKASGLGGMFFWQGTGDMTAAGASLVALSGGLLAV